MFASRSSVYKMLEAEARIDRKINDFPKPYSSSLTEYNQTKFSQLVTSACSSYLPLIAGLKLSKSIIVGDMNVGKTSLVNRFCHQSFSNGYKATIGVDFEIERFDILKVPFNLQIWDTAGQERFKCIAAAYYRSSHAIIVVFDLTSRSSLEHCFNWLNEALESNADTPLIFLVGTKFDLLTHSEYLEVESKAGKIAQQMGAEYWAVSSRTGDGVNEFFFRVAALTFERIVLSEVNSITSPSRIKLGNFKNETDAKERSKTCTIHTKCNKF